MSGRYWKLALAVVLVVGLFGAAAFANDGGGEDCYEDVIVTGDEVAEGINGTYVFDYLDETNRPVFASATGALFFTGGGNYWFLTDYYSGVGYINESTPDTPPHEGWVEIDEGTPATFSMSGGEACGSPTPPGISVTPTSGLTTTEAGGTATFTVVLDTLPTATVTIGISSSDTTEGEILQGVADLQPQRRGDLEHLPDSDRDRGERLS